MSGNPAGRPLSPVPPLVVPAAPGRPREWVPSSVRRNHRTLSDRQVPVLCPQVKACRLEQERLERQLEQVRGCPLNSQSLSEPARPPAPTPCAPALPGTAAPPGQSQGLHVPPGPTALCSLRPRAVERASGTLSPAHMRNTCSATRDKARARVCSHGVLCRPRPLGKPLPVACSC